MGDFLRGWERKLGLTTLVIALAFVAAWGRSQSKDVPDDFRIPVTRTVELGVLLRPKFIHLLKYTTFTEGIVSATGAQSLARIQYWSVITPLTLLSTWLLMIKPRLLTSAGPRAAADKVE